MSQKKFSTRARSGSAGTSAAGIFALSVLLALSVLAAFLAAGRLRDEPGSLKAYTEEKEAVLAMLEDDGDKHGKNPSLNGISLSGTKGAAGSAANRASVPSDMSSGRSHALGAVPPVRRLPPHEALAPVHLSRTVRTRPGLK